MHTFSANVWGVLISAAFMMIIGMVWYSPLLFGKKWMELIGMTPDMVAGAKQQGRKSIAIMVLVSLVMSYVLAVIINNLLILSIRQAALVGLATWIGFVATTMSTEYLFVVQKRPWQLYLINTGYHLASLVVGSVILYFFSV
jgi:hypothetical protein